MAIEPFIDVEEEENGEEFDFDPSNPSFKLTHQ